jgi:peptidoglycan/xylan/chitin deacetylase (PgdA/CDA1 family)
VLPGYYSELAPFRRVFARGNPILTYHKLGPRPAGVRLKGLYVSGRLFAKQLAELHAAGYQSGSLAECAGPFRKGRVVLTFDDGYVNVLAHGLKPLQQHRFTAVQFLVANLLGRHNEWDVLEGEAPEPMMDAAQARDWLAAGHDIGSHTLTHPFLTRIPLAQAREEITASKKRLEDTFGRAIEHFCYPYGDWSPAVRDVVMAAGYKTASTTDQGVNHRGDSPLELKRFTARYPSRNLKAIWSRLRARLGR